MHAPVAPLRPLPTHGKLRSLPHRSRPAAARQTEDAESPRAPPYIYIHTLPRSDGHPPPRPWRHLARTLRVMASRYRTDGRSIAAPKRQARPHPPRALRRLLPARGQRTTSPATRLHLDSRGRHRQLCPAPPDRKPADRHSPIVPDIFSISTASIHKKMNPHPPKACESTFAYYFFILLPFYFFTFLPFYLFTFLKRPVAQTAGCPYRRQRRRCGCNDDSEYNLPN